MNEPLVLVPGMMCDERLFAPQLEAFAAHRAMHVLLPTGQASIEGIAADLLAQAPEYFALAGLSMGGIAAMEMLRQAPGRVKRLALLDTNPLAEAANRVHERDAQIARVKTLGLTTVMRDEMKPHYLADGPNAERILKLCMQMAERLGVDEFIHQSRALQSRPDQTDTLRGVSVPTLVLCGKHDTLCPLERHTLMHSLVAHSQLVVIPDAGHLPTLEQPGLTNRALERWLECEA